MKWEREERKGGAYEEREKTVMDYFYESIFGKLYLMAMALLNSLKDTALQMQKMT